jgi:hypothetical protein
MCVLKILDWVRPNKVCPHNSQQQTAIATDNAAEIISTANFSRRRFLWALPWIPYEFD